MHVYLRHLHRVCTHLWRKFYRRDVYGHFFTVPKENSIKSENETFFSTNRKSYLEMIWHQDKHWKPSPGSTLEGFKLGLVIFDDMDEFFSKIWVTCQIRSKRWIWDFFIYRRILASRSKISLWHYQKWKKHTQIVFPSLFILMTIFEKFPRVSSRPTWLLASYRFEIGIIFGLSNESDRFGRLRYGGK